MEIWKRVVVDRENKDKYYELYKVSNLGRIKNKKDKIMKPKKCKDGYLRVNLSFKGEQKSYSVHRLVLLAFDYDGYFEKAECNHKDENKANNCLENLEWCTAKYNSNYGTRIKRCTSHLRDGTRTNLKTSCKKVVNLNNGIIYESAFECSKQLGINYKTLNGYLKGRIKNNKYNLCYLENTK